MKFEMKKFFLLLLLILFYTNAAFAQGGPSGPPCDCCTDLEPEEGEPPSPAYTQCVNECLDGTAPCVPIDSSSALLLFTGISLGFLFVNKKRIFHK